MIILGKYEEFAPGMGFPSIMGHMQPTPYGAKAKVLKYLKSGRVHMATAARIVDAVTGEAASQTLLHMNDGEYSWSSRLIYHIEKYNLRLPEDVEKNILRKA